MTTQISAFQPWVDSLEIFRNYPTQEYSTSHHASLYGDYGIVVAGPFVDEFSAEDHAALIALGWTYAEDHSSYTKAAEG